MRRARRVCRSPQSSCRRPHGSEGSCASREVPMRDSRAVSSLRLSADIARAAPDPSRRQVSDVAAGGARLGFWPKARTPCESRVASPPPLLRRCARGPGA
eukprot:5657465-Pyramimonas_sp.AAC.1